jgi:hypothetical protein
MSQIGDSDPYKPPEVATRMKIDGSKVEGIVAGDINLSGGKNKIIGMCCCGCNS